jgi:hypothetical protein
VKLYPELRKKFELLAGDNYKMAYSKSDLLQYIDEYTLAKIKIGGKFYRNWYGRYSWLLCSFRSLKALSTQCELVVIPDDVAEPADLCPEIPLSKLAHPKFSKIGSASNKQRDRLRTIKSTISDLRAEPNPSATAISELLKEATEGFKALTKMAVLASKKRSVTLCFWSFTIRFQRKSSRTKSSQKGRPAAVPHENLLTAMSNVAHRRLTAAHDKRRDGSVASTMTLAELSSQTERELQVPVSKYTCYLHTKPRNKRMSIAS